MFIQLLLWMSLTFTMGMETYHSRFKNINAAMRGYNLLTGDPLHNSFDPGFKNQIFDPYTEGGTLDSSITASHLSNCQRSLKTEVFTNIQSLRNNLEEESSSGVNLQLGYTVKIRGELGYKGIGVSAETEIPPAFTRAWSQSNSFKQASSLFVNEHGLVSLTRGSCISYQVSLNEFSFPKFTSSFEQALRRLYTVKNAGRSVKVEAFRRFINNFGTHFMMQSQLGASFVGKSSYSGKMRKIYSAESLKACSSVVGSKIFGIQVEKDRSDCSSTTENSLNNHGSQDYKIEVLTKGSRPTSIKEWATQDFTPVPLKNTFSPIVNLFTKKNIDEWMDIDGAADDILKWFLPLYEDICNVMGYDCTKKTGCGINDKCPDDAICSGSGTKHECSEWSQWTVIGTYKKRTRTCEGCNGKLIEEYDSAKVGDCKLLFGRHGDILKCPKGYVGTGACGSGGGNDCGMHKTSILQCCKVRQLPDKVSQCSTSKSRYGVNINCSPNSITSEYCGSRIGHDCAGNWNLLQCCHHNALKVTSTCKWSYKHAGIAKSCDNGYVMTGSCGSGSGADCHGEYHGVRCCALAKPKAVDSCVILQGTHGQRLDCPNGYVATGACGSGAGTDCGYRVTNRLKCCKARVRALSTGCFSKSTGRYGQNLVCPTFKDNIRLVTQYCGSRGGADCAGRQYNQINCCELTGLSADPLTCHWMNGDYGEFLQCKSGYAMAGACGSGGGRDCQNNSAHGIYCCKVH